MSVRRSLVLIIVLAAAAVAGLMVSGHLPVPGKLMQLAGERKGAIPVAPEAAKAALAPPLAVTVVRAEPASFVETVLVTGSLVAREEILVGPEIEGLRIVEVLAEEGDRVTRGQVLARLVSDTLEAQLAQNTAALARADASIAQARSAIASAEARLEEATNAYDRAKPLTKQGYLSESGMDQRESARRTTEAALASAKDGLLVSEAEKAQIEAQRREILWRRARTDIRAPADGLISRRNAKIGSYASGIADPMFRIVAKGEIELDAEVPETRLGVVKEGQTARIDPAGSEPVIGTVRLVSPEVDRATRLGRVRIMIGDKPGLRVGAFAKARIETGRSRGLAVPSAAVLFAADGPVVQVVADGRIATRKVRTGLAEGTRIEIVEGLLEGEKVVARSGTFLRDGDAVQAVPVDGRQVSEAG
ncbi:MAG: efflux RND transporter periplasmic adaptor subunit, partial [Hyphomicrobiaceae bacterium]